MLALTNGGALNNGSQIIVGGTGGATLAIQGGAVANNYSGANNAMYVGGTASQTGSVSITSGTLAAAYASTIMLGENGAGYWDQSGGSATLAGPMWLGNGSTGRGQITLTGGSLSVGGVMQLGVRSTAILTLSGSSTSATLNGGLTMGFYGVGNSYSTVNMNSGTLTIGGNGMELGDSSGGSSSSLFNQTGGTVVCTGSLLYVGNQGGGTQQMIMSGGTFTSTPGMLLAIRGTASLTVTNTAFMTLPYLSFGHGSTSGANGTANLDGGTLKVGYISKLGSNNGTFNFNGGTLLPSGSSTTFMQGLTAAAVMDGGALIDTTNNAITIAQPLTAGGTGIGGVTKRGSGTLTLTGANTYSGPTTINAGTLQLGNGGTTGTL